LPSRGPEAGGAAGVNDATAAERLPLTALNRVGPRVAERLARLGLHSVQDLLFHLPLRYEDRATRVPLGALRPGQTARVSGTVELAQVQFGRRRALLCRIADGTGTLTLRFFHFSRQQQQGFQRGTPIDCFGEARPGPTGLEMVHPEYRLGAPAATAPARASLTPVYPVTEGIRQPTLRQLVGQALERVASGRVVIHEWLPPDLLRRYRLPPLTEAVQRIHAPPLGAAAPGAAGDPLRRRLAFEELLGHQLSLRQLRARLQQYAAPVLAPPGALCAALRASLPFTLTAAQARVIAEIHADLARGRPMLRLLQGDVGSGKTVVAATAVLQAVEAGWQAVVVAPTELLAEQHAQSFDRWLEPLGIASAWLGGRAARGERRATLAALADGSAQVAVGTHALFQEEPVFARLGLVVIDEQHRFGVHQRLALRDKGAAGGRRPHQLIMTATPIPRTLAMAAYADLDLSVIDELPPGRKAITTVALPARRRDEVVTRVRDACAEGRQAYWVCTLIEESEALEAEAAAATAADLAAALPELRVGLVHGRLRGADKAAVMAAFKDGRIDLLVATTVIEVGVDVANATLMIIDNAERLGLAQLHQLRGRVGRGAAQSFCVLLYREGLSANARRRLEVLRESQDGFAIARRDLEIRGPGEVLGTRQTGELQLRVADLLRDQGLLADVQQCAEALLADHPASVEPLIERWLGARTRYGDV
jgi:ATP-dependent DNA helicase RecG